MQLVVMLIISLILGSESVAQVQPNPGATFGIEMQSYFRHPDAKSIVDKFFALPPSEVSRRERSLIVATFFSQLINKDPTIGDLLVERSRDANSAFKPTVTMALNQSHHPRRTELIRDVGGDAALKGLLSSSFELRTFPIVHPIHLDMMWAGFFATGEGAYVERIAEKSEAYVSQDQIRVLGQTAKDDPQAKNLLLNAIIAQAAVWSLTSNAANYPEVRSALVNLVQHHQGKAAVMAAAILAKTNPK